MSTETNVTVPKVAPATTVDEQIKLAELQARQLELEIKKQQLEALQLEQEERRYHIKDLKARLAERELTERQLIEDRAAQGRTFAQQDATDNYRFGICTHRKGGKISARDNRVLHTGGNGEQFAVIKHQMINGDIWVRCLRCGKTWSPPVEKNFFFDAKGRNVAPQDGTFNQTKFNKSVEQYEAAVMYPTGNSMSTSVQCRFTTVNELGQKIDAAQIYRENIASTTLR
jgi:hypothetical protein